VERRVEAAQEKVFLSSHKEAQIALEKQICGSYIGQTQKI